MRATPYQVLLGLLGRDFHQIDPPAPQKAGQTYFPATGHNLGGAFPRLLAEPWRTVRQRAADLRGDSPRFSPDDGKAYMVQYFERARYEYHPENKGTAYEVLLGLLGNRIVRERGWDSVGAPGLNRPEIRYWLSSCLRRGGLVGEGGVVVVVFGRVEALQLAAERPGLVEQLARGGAARDLLRLARRAQALVERLDRRVVARGAEGRHVQRGAQPRVARRGRCAAGRGRCAPTRAAPGPARRRP